MSEEETKSPSRFGHGRTRSIMSVLAVERFPAALTTAPDPSGWETGPKELRASSLATAAVVTGLTRFFDHERDDPATDLALHGLLDTLPADVVKICAEQTIDAFLATPGAYE